MKFAQLVKITETTLYLKEGIVCEVPNTPTKKLMHSIYGETIIKREESVIERWALKTKGEANEKFWNFIKDSGEESANYFIVFSF